MTYQEALLLIISQAKQQIEAISTAEINTKASPDKWSKKETLGHLIDSAFNNHLRFVTAESKEDLVFQSYDQVAWVKQNDYQNRNIKEVLSFWVQINIHLSRAVAKIPVDVLNRQHRTHNFYPLNASLFNQLDTASLAYFIWDYLYHTEHHLSQIIPDYEKMLPAFENFE